MFEDCLVESSSAPASSGKRWTTLASISLQFAIAAVVIALPLLHPEALPFHLDTPKVLLPPKPPVPLVRTEQTSATSTSTAVPTPTRQPIVSTLLPNANMAVNDTPPPLATASGMGASNGVPNGLLIGEGGHAPSVSVAPAKGPAKPLRISLGVSEGMLIAPIRPIYPAIAKAAHVEGTVVVEAVISKTGTIESLHVISGPSMLQGAAIDAIRAARYRPCQLNGEATEVQTSITVNFRLGA